MTGARGGVKVATAVAAVVMLSGVASGQVVTTPPSRAPNPAEAIPVQPQLQPTNPTRRIQDGRTGAMQTMRAQQPQAAMPAFQSLVERDTEGRVRPLREHLELAALRRNPLVTPEMMAAMEGYLAERRRTYETLVIDNLQTVEQVYAGALAGLSLTDVAGLTRMRDTIRPLLPPNAPRGLAEELRVRNLIPQRVADLNRTIASDFTRAAMPRAAAGASAEEKTQIASDSLAFTARQSIGEALMTHRALLLEAGSRIGTLLPRLGLPGEVAARVQTLATSLAADGTEEGRFRIMQDLMALLPYEKRQELLRATVATR